MKNKNTLSIFSTFITIKKCVPTNTNVLIFEFVCPKTLNLSWDKVGFGWKQIPQQLWSFSSSLNSHNLEGIVRFESRSLFNYDISALIDCYIFDKNISINIQLGTRNFKTSTYRNKLTLLKFNISCGMSHDVNFLR